MVKVSIIVPIYNEVKTVEQIIRKLLDIDFSIDKEIILVDDGSSDGTTELLKNIQTKYDKLKIIFHEKNLGKGAAIRTGLCNVSGDIIAIQDADLEYNPEELKQLILPILNCEYEIVYGSRFLKKNPVIYKKYYLGNKFMTFIVNLLFGAKLTDSYTCYKVFSKRVLEGIILKSKGFEIEAELTSIFLKCRYKILELPISYSPRTLLQGKKIKFKDAIKGLLTILRVKIFRTI